MASEVAGVKRKLDKILSKTKSVGPIGCLEYSVGTTRGKYGRYHMTYPPIEPQGSSFKAQMTASRAVYILHKRRPDMVGEPGTGHVSHLCHNPKCVNIEHLHLESQIANERRKPCQFKKECQGTCDPVCIFPPQTQFSGCSGPSRLIIPWLHEPPYI